MSSPSTNANKGRVIAFTRWFIVLMCAGFVCGGAMSFWHGLRERRLNNEAAGWPAAEAQVLRGWVKTVETKTGNYNQYRGQIYEVMVDFTFTIEGQTLNGSSPAPRQIGDEEGKIEAQAIADSFAPGSSLPVYYQPGNPKENRLRRIEVATHVWIWFAVLGGLMVPASLYGIWWMLCRFERVQKSSLP